MVPTIAKECSLSALNEEAMQSFLTVPGKAMLRVGLFPFYDGGCLPQSYHS